MPTNNQNLPPVPHPPEDYRQTQSSLTPPVPFSSSNPQSPSQPKPANLSTPPVPPLPPAGVNTEQVNLIDPALAVQSNKKIIILTVISILAVFAVYGIYAAMNLRKNANVSVSGNEVKFHFQNSEIIGQMGGDEAASFVTNGGQITSDNAGLFAVIPSSKVRYLEQKYSDIVHCGSAGVEEVKSNQYSAYFLLGNSNAQKDIERLDRLMKKGNWVEFEITGKKISQMKANQGGKNFSIMNQGNLVFYLIDSLRIIEEDYK